jgi:hypothetical protein
MQACIESLMADPWQFAAAARRRIEDFGAARAAAGIIQTARQAAYGRPPYPESQPMPPSHSADLAEREIPL